MAVRTIEQHASRAITERPRRIVAIEERQPGLVAQRHGLRRMATGGTAQEFGHCRDLCGTAIEPARRVQFTEQHATRTRDAALLRQWTPQILRVSPYGKTRTLTLAAANIARMAVLELAGRWPGRPRVLYRR